MDMYHLRSRDLPTTRPDPVQGVHTSEGTRKSDDDEEPSGRASSSLLFHGHTRQSYLYNGRLPWYNVVLTHGRRHEYPWADEAPV